MARDREQIAYGEVVGVTENGEVYILDYVFEDTLHGERFAGAVGSILRPVTRAEYENATSQDELEERYVELWQESVASGATEQSLAEFAADVFRYDGDEAIWDHSDYEHWDEARRHVARLERFADEVEEAGGNLEEAFPVMESIGGGRIFGFGSESGGSAFDRMQGEFELMPNTELWLDINRAEGEE